MSKITKILITEPREIAEAALKMLDKAGYTTINNGQNEYENTEISGLFIRTYTRVDKEYLSKFPNLQFILRAGVGVDNIDITECKARGILIYNSPGANADAVSEYIFAMSLYLLRQIDLQRRSIDSGNWRNPKLKGTGFSGQKFGIIGCGNVGTSLSKKLQLLGAKCLGYDPYVSVDKLVKVNILKCSLPDLLCLSDIIVVAIPLTKNTKGLLSYEKIAMMKKGAYLINVSRGEIVDEVALATAVRNHTISGAALDVITGEPNISKDLKNIPNLIITPHIAGFTESSNLQIATQVVENFLKGKSL